MTQTNPTKIAGNSKDIGLLPKRMFPDIVRRAGDDEVPPPLLHYC
jgi:hypothetical protein